MDRRLKLVPWEPTWLAHQSLDLHAIYRRPQRVRDQEADSWDIDRDDEGCIKWDLTPGMSIRNHQKFMQKGMEYVTLATVEDVTLAGDPSIAEKGATPLGAGTRVTLYPDEHGPADYIRQSTGVRGPWNATAYLKDLADERAEKIARVRENVVEHGPDLAERFEQQTDPGYRLPAKYREAVAETRSELAEPPKRKRGRPRKVQPEEAVTA
jgi:hypothetical protein